jgi:serpin B
MPMPPLTRRDLMRSLSLAALAVSVPSLVVGCSSSDDPGSGPSGGGDSDVRLVSSDARRTDGDAAAIPDAVSSLHALSGGLYGALAAKAGNLAISPYSVGVALALTVNGARGTTLDEMLGVLDATGTGHLNDGLNALTQRVESLAGTRKRADGSDAEVALDAANAMFGQQGIEWQPDFLDTLARDYGAGMQTVDYERATEAARTAINAWTAERTQDRIEELIPPDILDGLTRLVLVNALYFKAPWEEPFEKEVTQPGDFHLDDGSVAQVPLMRAALERASLATGDGWVAVQLPYAGGDLAMTVVLPDEGRMRDLEAAVAAGDLAPVLDTAPGSVDLTLPSWTFRTAAPLKGPLAEMGMPTAFTDDADFSGMTAEVDLLISEVLHQAFIAVDEDGTEAAAATAVVMRETSAMRPDASVVVDRPFLFVIHDVEHGTPLFVGRVSDPRG